MAVPKCNQRAVQKYVKNNYDRIEFTVPKGQKDVIKAIADSQGVSVNAFIKNAIQKEIERLQAENNSVSCGLTPGAE